MAVENVGDQLEGFGDLFSSLAEAPYPIHSKAVSALRVNTPFKRGYLGEGYIAEMGRPVRLEVFPFGTKSGAATGGPARIRRIAEGVRPQDPKVQTEFTSLLNATWSRLIRLELSAVFEQPQQ